MRQVEVSRTSVFERATPTILGDRTRTLSSSSDAIPTHSDPVDDIPASLAACCPKIVESQTGGHRLRIRESSDYDVGPVGTTDVH